MKLNLRVTIKNLFDAFINLSNSLKVFLVLTTFFDKLPFKQSGSDNPPGNPKIIDPSRFIIETGKKKWNIADKVLKEEKKKDEEEQEEREEEKKEETKGKVPKGNILKDFLTRGTKTDLSWLVWLIILGVVGFFLIYFFSLIGVIIFVFILIIFVKWKFRNKKLNWLFIILLILLIFIFFIYPIFSPLFNYWFSGSNHNRMYHGRNFVKNIGYETRKTNEELSNFIEQSRLYIEQQIACAMDMCPEGEAEGPQVGIMVSEPQPMYEKRYIVGEDISFSSTIHGYNLDVYPSVVITPHCYIENEEVSVYPKKIPFVDISNYEAIVRCFGKTKPSTFYYNRLNVSLVFNFTTESDLRLYVIDNKTRNSLMSVFGNDFMYDVFGIEGEPVAKYNDGPINLGIRSTQYPIAARPESDSEEAAALVFALTNQWYTMNGEITRINYIKIIVPDGVSIKYDDRYCPFKKAGDNVYELSDFVPEQPIKTVLNYFCTLNVEEKKGDFPVWTPHLRIVANYEYRINTYTDIDVFKKVSGGSGSPQTQTTPTTPTTPTQTGVSSVGFIWPIDYKPRVYSKFGWRIHPITGTKKFHYGIDIDDPGDTNDFNNPPLIRAVYDGTVTDVGDGCRSDKNLNDGVDCVGYGNYVVIDHGVINGKRVATYYGHLKRGVLVKKGDTVKKGQIIGYMGSSGLSTDMHLHLEIREDNNPVDPLIKYYDASKIECWDGGKYGPCS